MSFEDFKKRYDQLTETTKQHTANALKGILITSESEAVAILEFAESFDKLVKLGLAK